MVPFDAGLGTLRSWRAARRGAFNLDAGCTREAFAAAVSDGLACAAKRDAARNGTPACAERERILDASGIPSACGSLVLSHTDESSGDEDEGAPARGRPFATILGGTPPPTPSDGAATGRTGGTTGRKRTTRLNRPDKGVGPAAAGPPPEGEYTSVRDAHLWYGAMLRVGVDDATALAAVRERIGCSEAFAAYIVSSASRYRLSEKPAPKKKPPAEPAPKAPRDNRGTKRTPVEERNEDGSYFRDFAITRPTKRQLALVDKQGGA